MNRIYISVSDLIEVLTRRNPYRYLWNREEHCQDTRYSALLHNLHVRLRNSPWYLSELRLRCYRAIVLAYIRIAIELEMRTPFPYHWQEPAQPSVLIARSISRVENNVISTNCDGGNLMQDAEQTVWSPLTAQTAFSTTSSREIRNQVTVSIQLSWTWMWGLPKRTSNQSHFKATRGSSSTQNHWSRRNRRWHFKAPCLSEPSRNGAKSTMELFCKLSGQASCYMGRFHQFHNAELGVQQTWKSIACIPES